MSTFYLEKPSTGQREDEFQRFDDKDRDDVLARSTAAFASWRRTSIDERVEILDRTADIYEKNKDLYAEHIGREMGKLTEQANGIYAQAVQDRNTAQGLTDQATVE